MFTTTLLMPKSSYSKVLPRKQMPLPVLDITPDYPPMRSLSLSGLCWRRCCMSFNVVNVLLRSCLCFASTLSFRSNFGRPICVNHLIKCRPTWLLCSFHNPPRVKHCDATMMLKTKSQSKHQYLFI